MNVPKNLLYTKKHAWVKLKKDQAVVGLTDELQERIDSALSVHLPSVGDELEMDHECLTIHSESKSDDFFSPLTGRVVAVNTELKKRPELLHTSPYEDGWLFEMEFDEQDELEMLYSPNEYLHELEFGTRK